MKSTKQKMKKKRTMNRALMGQGGDPDINISRVVGVEALKVRD